MTAIEIASELKRIQWKAQKLPLRVDSYDIDWSLGVDIKKSRKIICGRVLSPLSPVIYLSLTCHIDIWYIGVSIHQDNMSSRSFSFILMLRCTDAKRSFVIECIVHTISCIFKSVGQNMCNVCYVLTIAISMILVYNILNNLIT